MNQLQAKIEDIKVHGNLSLVKVRIAQITLTSIVIETPETAPYLQVGAPIKVMFKETEVIMALETSHGVSLQNQLPVTITNINTGALLSELTLDFLGNTIRSIITSQAVTQLNLTSGCGALAMIKTNEIMLST